MFAKLIKSIQQLLSFHGGVKSNRLWFKPIVYLSSILLFFIGVSNLYSNELANSSIIYLQSGVKKFEATLIPEDPSGTVAIDSQLVRICVDEQTIASQISAKSNKNGSLHGAFPILHDGRHRAFVESFLTSGAPLDRRERLLFVDRQPPVIEIVLPDGNFPRESRQMVFKIVDAENGSGVDVDFAVNGLEVASSGVSIYSRNLVLFENQLYLILYLQFPDGFARHSATFSVNVSIKDRAGNVGVLKKTFSVRKLTEPVFHFFSCGSRSYVETSAEFLVFPEPQALELRAGKSMTTGVMIFGYNGKAYQYPPIVERDTGKSREINRVSPFFQDAVGKRVEITSVSGNISIQKIADTDRQDCRVQFSVRQDQPVDVGSQIDFLKIRYPVAILIDKNTDFCRASRSIKGPNDSIYDHIPEDKIKFRYETLLYPVVLEVENSPFRLNLFTEGESLIAEVVIDPIQIMDTGASWFAVDGVKNWFDRHARPVDLRSRCRRDRFTTRLLWLAGSDPIVKQVVATTAARCTWMMIIWSA